MPTGSTVFARPQPGHMTSLMAYLSVRMAASAARAHGPTWSTTGRAVARGAEILRRPLRQRREQGWQVRSQNGRLGWLRVAPRGRRGRIARYADDARRRSPATGRMAHATFRAV